MGDDDKNGVLKNLRDIGASRANSKEQGEGGDFVERSDRILSG